MENEILLKQVLRTYRNAIVNFVRDKLQAHFGANAEKELSALFSKFDPVSKTIQWDRMRQNAARARAAPEISTSAEDEFDILGVAEFYPIFEKFYDVLFPEISAGDPAIKTESRNGVLRCLRQVKVFRDPNAHEVTEDSDINSLTLSMANAITVLKTCSAEREAQIIRGHLLKLIGSKPNYSALLLFHSKVGEEMARSLTRIMKSKGVQCTLLELSQLTIGDHVRSSIEACKNVIPVACANTNGSSNLKQVVEYALGVGNRIVPVRADTISDEVARVVLGPSVSNSVVYHPQYIHEAADRVVSKLISNGLRPQAVKSIQSISTVEALADEKFKTRLISSLRMPGWKAIWLVSPFASDVKEWTLTRQSLSLILSQLRQAGANITFITRPPSDTEDREEKQRFLERLQLDDIEVLLNESLHAKIYLFEADAKRVQWYLGSHNLTVSGLSRWRDVSMTGFREAEYAQAKTAMDRIQNHRETKPYHIWKAQEARGPREIQ